MVSVKSVTSDALKVTVDFGSGPIDALYLGQGQDGSKQQGDNLAESLTALGQRRQLLDDLPIDDPDRTIDPANGEMLFHERNGPNEFLVANRAIFENPVWIEAETRWVFTVRNPRGA